MITSVLDGLEVLFNPCTGRVEDSTGRRHLVSIPDVGILMLAEDIRRSLSLLQLSCKDLINGTTPSSGQLI